MTCFCRPISGSLYGLLGHLWDPALELGILNFFTTVSLTLWCLVNCMWLKRCHATALLNIVYWELQILLGVCTTEVLLPNCQIGIVFILSKHYDI